MFESIAYYEQAPHAMAGQFVLDAFAHMVQRYINATIGNQYIATNLTTDVTHPQSKIALTTKERKQMNREVTELNTDYFLSNFGQATATGLSKVINGEISHDQTTRFLNKENFTAKQLWKLVKPYY